MPGAPGNEEIRNPCDPTPYGDNGISPVGPRDDDGVAISVPLE
jgi:hypothetical protein